MKIKDLKATCPHCKHYFWKLDTFKGIKFCPSCKQSVFIKNNNTAKNKWHFIFTGVSVLFFIIFVFELYAKFRWPHDSSWRIFDIAMLFVYGLLTIILLISLILFAHHTLTNIGRTLNCGIDKLTQTHKDLGGYQPILSAHTNRNQIGKIIHCPNCHSQRMQDMYHYKKNLARGRVWMETPKEIGSHFSCNGFIGCLNCKNQYLRTRATFNYVLIVIVLAIMLLPVLLSRNLDKALFDMVSLSGGVASFIVRILFTIVWLYLIALLVHLFYSKNPSHLKLINDKAGKK